MNKNITIKLLAVFFISTVFLFSFRPDSVAQNITKPNVIGPAGLEVNTFNGSLLYRRTDMQLKGRGLDLDLTFTYSNNLSEVDDGFGLGFTMPYNMSYYTDSVFLVVTRADGRKDNYLDNGDGSFTPPTGYFDELEEYETGKYRLIEKSGLTYYFEDGGHKKLTRMVDRYGNTITIGYADGKPVKLTDPSGRSVTLNWTDGHLVEVVDALETPTRKLSYSYDNDKNLVRVVNFEGYSHQYRYDAPGNLVDVLDPNKTTFNVIYNNNGAVNRLCSPLNTQVFLYNTRSRTTYLVEEGISGKQTTAYQFDETGNLVEQTGNCCGYNLKFAYDEDNNIISQTDANGQEYTYSYDERGNVTSEKDPLGGLMAMTYEEKFNLKTSETDKNGNTTNYIYDAKGNLLSVERPLDISESFTYDAFGYPITYTDGNGNVTAYEYDANGYLTKLTDPLGNAIEYTYDQRGRLLQLTDKRGSVTTFDHDIMDRPVTTTDTEGGVTRMEYDANGNMVTMMDANGRLTTFAYDGLDRLVKTTDPLGNSELRVYDPKGNLVSQIDKNGNTTKMLYDNLNRLSQSTNAEGEITTFEYDASGNTIAKLLSNGNVIEYTYDALNRIVERKDKLGQLFNYNYDQHGNLLEQTDANGNTTRYDYDALNRLIKVTDPLGEEAKITLDNNHNLVYFTNRKGNRKEYIYDGMDRKISMVDALGNLTRYVYDPNDNLSSVTDANGNTTAYTYDKMDRLITETFADNTTKAYVYDPVGNQLSMTDNAGKTTAYTYDELNRLLKNDYPDSPDETFTYDAGGRMISAVNEHAIVNFSYDKADRVLTEVLNGKTTAYTYDIPNRRRTLTYPSGRQVTEVMDQRGRMADIFEGNSAIARRVHDGADRLTSMVMGNNTSTGYQYDNNDRLIALTHNPGAFIDYQYAYDANGNKRYRAKGHDQERSELFAYDANDRLIGYERGTLVGENLTAVTGEFSYQLDGVGNRTTVTENNLSFAYTVNEMNEYTGIVGESAINRGYDAKGNLVQDGTHILAYDDLNRMISVDGGATATYEYGPLGRRVKKITPEATNTYFYDGLKVIEEETDSKVSTFVYGSWIDDVLSMQKEGKDYYYHKDEMGSVVGITDDKGQLLEHYRYDAFGKVEILDGNGVLLTESSIANPYYFTGRRLEKETGYYYYRNRHYDPIHGRFLQRDPLGYIDGMGLYEYVKGRPNKMTDPLGLSSICPDYMDDLILALEIASLFNPLADLALMAIYAGRGDWQELVWAAIGLVPIVGDGLKLGRKGMKGAKGLKNLDNVHPSTPVGRKGSPMEVKPGTNTPTSINDRQYTGHALDRMQGRGVPPTVVEDAIRNPGSKTPGNTPGTTVYKNENVTVVTNQSGDVVTVY